MSRCDSRRGLAVPVDGSYSATSRAPASDLGWTRAGSWESVQGVRLAARPDFRPLQRSEYESVFGAVAGFGRMEEPLDKFSDLLAAVKTFRDDRDWAQFHSVKNLAAAIAVEAAELQELCLWVADIDEAEWLAGNRLRVEEELADVVIHCANLALAADIDVPTALRRKLLTNAAKYPASTSRGSAAKYTKPLTGGE
jgi:NTP pyrophosphatase (non-canonical NTP hydrolase)